MLASTPDSPPPWRERVIEPVRLHEADLDTSVRPQDDLDGFANARWRSANPLPPDHGCWDCFTILGELSQRQQADIAEAARRGEFGSGDDARIVGDFWATALAETCDHRGTEALDAEFARIDAIDDAASLAAWLRDSHARGADPLFRFAAKPDFADPSRMLLYVNAREAGLPDRQDFVADTPDAQRLRDAYHAHLAALLGLAGDSAGAAHVPDIIALERRLASALPSRRELARDIARTWRPITPADADREAPGFGWREFFAAAHARVERFSLTPPDYAREVSQALHGVAIPVWRALLRVRACEDAAPYLGPEWQRVHEAFRGGALRGRIAAPPRWKRALQAINAHAGESLGNLYAQRHDLPSANARVHELFETLRSALGQRLEANAWMSAATKTHALEKLQRLSLCVGGPDPQRESPRGRTARVSLYANVFEARAAGRRHELAQAAARTDARSWSLTPQTVNARYDPQRNSVLIPAALLRAPLYAADADAAMLYGGIGAVIAHEMTHAFDDQGSRFDADGCWRNWWADDDRRRFERLAERLVEAIGGMSGADGEATDGRLTLGENIADFGGLAIACDAFRHCASTHAASDPQLARFGPQQRFFLHWAALWRQNLSPAESRLRRRVDVHAPGPVRANAAAADLADYAAAFGCAPGDRMQRAAPERCGIW